MSYQIALFSFILGSRNFDSGGLLWYPSGSKHKVSSIKFAVCLHGCLLGVCACQGRKPPTKSYSNSQLYLELQLSLLRAQERKTRCI
jgi:hypothetical protein